MTCSRTQPGFRVEEVSHDRGREGQTSCIPPFRSRVLESEKLHFRFGTSPLSVDCLPRLSGFCRSICRFVPKIAC